MITPNHVSCFIYKTVQTKIVEFFRVFKMQLSIYLSNHIKRQVWIGHKRYNYWLQYTVLGFPSVAVAVAIAIPLTAAIAPNKRMNWVRVQPRTDISLLKLCWNQISRLSPSIRLFLWRNHRLSIVQGKCFLLKFCKDSQVTANFIFAGLYKNQTKTFTVSLVSVIEWQFFFLFWFRSDTIKKVISVESSVATVATASAAATHLTKITKAINLSKRLPMCIRYF